MAYSTLPIVVSPVGADDEHAARLDMAHFVRLWNKMHRDTVISTVDFTVRVSHGVLFPEIIPVRMSYRDINPKAVKHGHARSR